MSNPRDGWTIQKADRVLTLEGIEQKEEELQFHNRFNWAGIVPRISDDQVPSQRLTYSKEANLRPLLKPKFDVPSMRSVSGISLQEVEEDVTDLLNLLLAVVGIK